MTRVLVRLKARARRDLVAIRQWGDDNWGPVRTRDFLQGLIEAIQRLQGNPLMGRARTAFHPSLRSIRHRSYVIFYLIEEDTPVIVAVLHERRNLAALDFADSVEGDS